MEEADVIMDYDNSIHNTIIIDKFKMLYFDDKEGWHTYNIFVKKWKFWWSIFSYTAETKEAAYKQTLDIFKKLTQVNKRKIN